MFSRYSIQLMTSHGSSASVPVARLTPFGTAPLPFRARGAAAPPPRGLVECLSLTSCGPSGTRYRPLTGQSGGFLVADKRRTRQGQGVKAGAQRRIRDAAPVAGSRLESGSQCEDSKLLIQRVVPRLRIINCYCICAVVMLPARRSPAPAPSERGAWASA